MKYLEIIVRVHEGDQQPESIIYKRSIIVPPDLQLEDWQEQSVNRIKQASKEVARLLTEGIAQKARA
jgi:hypothetical protein